MSTYWVALHYNIDGNYSAHPLGVFSTKSLAVEAIWTLIGHIGIKIKGKSGPELQAYIAGLRTELETTGKCKYIYGYMVKEFELDKN